MKDLAKDNIFFFFSKFFIRVSFLSIGRELSE